MVIEWKWKEEWCTGRKAKECGCMHVAKKINSGSENLEPLNHNKST